MKSEIINKIDQHKILYSQCWEDTEILIEALKIQPEDICLSIASAGDNSLALLTQNPKKVIALDLNPAQLALLDLKVAAIKNLSYTQYLEFIGIRPSKLRNEYYELIKIHLSNFSLNYWNRDREIIQDGIIFLGKFDNFFKLFRKYIIPLIHSSQTIKQLFQQNNLQECREFYDKTWNNRRWRFLFKLFFSKTVVKRLGRNPIFFRYAKDNLAKRMFERTEYALTQILPKENPYLNWILTGEYSDCLPYYLKKENFSLIKTNIHKIEWHLLSIEAYLSKYPDQKFDRFNLSDIFEYMSQENFLLLFEKIINAAKPKARLVYWNLLVPRSCPEQLQTKIKSLSQIAEQYHLKDKTFFYSNFVIEEVI